MFKAIHTKKHVYFIWFSLLPSISINRVTKEEYLANLTKLQKEVQKALDSKKE